jgi:hypothetical protein
MNGHGATRELPSMPMLDENLVVEAVCKYLEVEGYVIEMKRTTIQHGIDIVATRTSSGAGRLLIEAKGATSAREGSARY